MAITFEVALSQWGRKLPAFGLAAGLALAGCSRQAQDTTVATEGPAPAATTETVQEPAPAAQDTSPDDALRTAKAVARKLQSSPFASANPALKISYSRALTAQLNTNYIAALSELQTLSKTPGLTPEQAQAVQDLIVQLQRAAGASVTSSQDTEPGPVYAFVPDGQAPFSTADPAVAESFSAAELALRIGDLARARMELDSLVANPQLNWQQKDAVNGLLSKLPQPAPGSTAGN